MSQTIAASEFKATCLALLDLVADSSEEIVITKHGRPVARLVPMPPPPTALIGSVTYPDDDALLSSTGDVWEADE